ncbi:hypothetical protein GS887_27695 [Rhodococcus hoagii]|nr:hypothetical protein [Prescottella equi]
MRGLVIVSDAGLVCADPEAGGGDHFLDVQAFIGAGWSSAAGDFVDGSELGQWLPPVCRYGSWR